MKNPSKNAGFTLVEVSIGIAILGLLVGAVIGGRAMMESQRLRTVSVDARNFIIATRQFKEKYAYLPGDFPTATTVWGRADGGRQ